jgi:hypothetical protein
MYCSTLGCDGQISNPRHFSFVLPEKQRSIQKGGDNRDKNWLFWAGAKTDYCLYSVRENELVILEFNPHGVVPIKTHYAHCHIPFIWRHCLSSDGCLRGGTPPILEDDGSVITFFHTMVKIDSAHFYLAGALRFSAFPPFNVSFISSKPLWRPDILAPEIDRPSASNHVFFPAGAVTYGDGYIVSVGDNDTFCRLYYVDKSNVM